MRWVFRFGLPGIVLCAGWTAEAAVLVSVPAALTAKPGDTIAVPVSVADATGVLGYFFELGHSEHLEFVRADKGALTVSWGDPAGNGYATGCSVAAFGSTAVNGTGTLVVVRLRVKDTAPNGHVSPLTFVQAELNDGGIPLTTHNGIVTVTQTVTMSIASAFAAEPGAELEVPILLDDATGVAGYFFELAYNDLHLEFIQAENGALTQNSGWPPPTVHDEAGTVTVAGMGVTALSGGGTIVRLVFLVRADVPDGEITSLSLTQAELNDGAISVVTEDTDVPINALPLHGGLLLAILLLGAAAGTLSMWRRKMVFPR